MLIGSMSGDMDIILILVDHRSSELWNYVELQCFLSVKTFIVIISFDSVRELDLGQSDQSYTRGRRDRLHDSTVDRAVNRL